MGLIEKINMTQGDTKPFLQFTILTDGIVTDITGATVKFKIRKWGESANINDAANQCTITDAVNGLCEYRWGANDLATAGDYEGELEITYSDTKVQTQFPKYLIRVRPQL